MQDGYLSTTGELSKVGVASVWPELCAAECRAEVTGSCRYFHISLQAASLPTRPPHPPSSA